MKTALEIVDAWAAAQAAGDREAMHALLHPQYRLYEPDGLSYRGVYEGPDGWWAFWDKFGETWEDVSIADHKKFTGPDESECAIMMRLSGRSVRSGRRFETTLMEYWRFRDGQILEMHPHYSDTRYLSEVEEG